MNISPTIFITGTDTNVGKTLVTALLGLRLQSLGVRVGAMKPWASGCEIVDGELVSDDAVFLRDTLQLEDDMNLICPVRYAEPLAPLVAARRLGESRDVMTPFRDALRAMQNRYDVVLVEGVGGLTVPIAQEPNGAIVTCEVVANELKSPVVVVARRTLGTINHTTMTCRAPLKSPSHFAGIVWCDATRIEENDVAAQTSPQVVEEMTGLGSLGQVPYLKSLEHRVLEDAAERFLWWLESFRSGV